MHMSRDSQATESGAPISPRSADFTVDAINKSVGEKAAATHSDSGSETATKPKSEATTVRAAGNESVEKEFRKYTTAKVAELFNNLRKETREIEGNIMIGETDVLNRDQHAFMMRRHELSLVYVSPPPLTCSCNKLMLLTCKSKKTP
jgi:hypothetical protein